LLRELARRDPDAFEPLLATNLDQLGKALKDQGIVGDAIEALREAVTVFRTVRRRTPTAFAVELAVSLTDLGSLIAASNTAREALPLGGESVTLLSSAVAGGALEHRAELSRALHEFGRSLAKCGERQAAIEAAEKAIALRRTLVAEGGLSHDRLALAHGSLGQIHHQFGNATDSAKAFEEGLAAILDSPTPRTDASRRLLRQLAASYASAAAANGEPPNERLVGRLERELEDVQG
jgi:tetratricopeptide (TPR) repeat protein